MQNDENVIPIDEDIELGLDDEEEEEVEGPSIMDATEEMAATLMRISKKTKMSETGVLNVFSFVWQQNEQAKARAMQGAQEFMDGQAMVDAIGAEQDAADDMVREADEEIGE